jgi:hypothetical protein
MFNAWYNIYILLVLSLLYLSVKNYIDHNLQVWVTSMSDDLRKASKVFTLVQSSEIR